MSSKILFVGVAIAVVAVAAFIGYNRLPLPDQNQDQLRTFSSYDELKSFLNQNAGSGGSFASVQKTVSESSGAPAPATADAGGRSTAGSSDYSTTNIQVAGVDEPDIVKNDGKYIYTISGTKVIIVDAYPAEGSKVLSEIEIENGTPVEIFINDDRLVVFGEEYNYYPYYRGGIEPLVAEKIAMPLIYIPPKAVVQVYDISDRSNPVLMKTVKMDGSYIDARMIGDRIYMISNSYINDIEDPTLPVIQEDGVNKTVPVTEIGYFPVPDYSYTYTNIFSLDVNNPSDSTSKVILMGSTQTLFVSQDNIYITYQKIFDWYTYTERTYDVIVSELPSDVQRKVNEIKSSNVPRYEKVYLIESNISEYAQGLSREEVEALTERITPKLEEAYREMAAESDKTIIHRISIDGGNIEHRASGEVRGHLLNQFSMDENNGYLRVATTSNNFGFWGGPIIMSRGVATDVAVAVAEPSSTPPSVAGGSSGSDEPIPVDIGGGIGGDVAPGEIVEKPEPTIIDPAPRIREPTGPQSWSNVYILDSSLNTVGKLENIAPDERIYSSRFIGDRVYLITFRQVDPLFVIDLSDVSNPRILGELKIPGFSEYLHPYDENHIIGIGKEVSTEGPFARVEGVKLGLFDVSDPNNPKEISKYVIGNRGSDSEALRDHRAFLFDREKNILVIPVLVAELKDNEFWGTYTWQGAYVFGVTPGEGFQLKGQITHGDAETQKEYYYYYGPYSVKRTLYIDTFLYTVSDKFVKANNLSDLSEVVRIELPYEENMPPIILY